MAAIEPMEADASGRRKFRVQHPATLEPLGEFAVTTPEEVRATVQRARSAQQEWARTSLDERVALMRRAIDVLLARQDEWVDVIMRDTGRGRVETILMEMIPAADVMAWFSKHAKSMLSDEKVGLQTLLKAKRMVVTYRPMGVVGVITPWNGPFILGLNPAVPALLAGNAVVIKPSEVTPFSGALVEDLFREAGFPEGLVQVVQGDGETGAALIDAGIDKLSFTGSTATGRKVGAACGRNLIPFTLELGGKDAAIVCADANIERAARGVVYGAMFNTGQFCCGTERCYVVRSVADEFIDKAVAAVRELKQDCDGTQDVSAMIWPKQVDIIDEQVADAVAKGARVLIGGRRNPGFSGAAYEPTVLVDVNHNMKVMVDETFGPVLPIMVVEDEDEALALANDSRYGLSGTIWAGDDKRALALAKGMQTGSICVNESSLTYGAHAAPFGGLKESGVGHVHGPNSIRQFCRSVPVIFDRLKMKTEQNWYPLTEDKGTGMQKFLKVFYGSKILRKLA